MARYFFFCDAPVQGLSAVLTDKERRLSVGWDRMAFLGYVWARNPPLVQLQWNLLSSLTVAD